MNTSTDQNTAPPTAPQDSLSSLIIETVPSLVVVVDADGIVLRFNPACEKLTGYSRHEIVGRPIWDRLLVETDVGLVRDALHGTSQKPPPWRSEHRWRTRDGALRLIDWSTDVLRDEHGVITHIIGTGVDITEQRHHEDALRDSERRYQELSSIAPVGIFRSDITGRCIYANARWLELNNRTMEQAIGIEWSETVHPDDIPSIMDAWTRAAVAESNFSCEYRLRRPDGKLVWVIGFGRTERDADGKTVGHVGTSTDITARKLVEQQMQTLNKALEKRVADRTSEALSRSEQVAKSDRALRDLTRLQQSILNSLGDGVFVSDKNGRFILFNPMAAEITGLEINDVPSEQWPDYFGCFKADGVTKYKPDELPLMRAVHGEAVDDEEMFLRHARRPDGVWVGCTARPLRDESGQIQGGVLVVHDRTERKQVETLLRDQQGHYRELAEHNRRLMQEVEHRVRNNLAGLVGLVSSMMHKTADVKAFGTAIESRLMAMVHVHQMLASSGWKAVNLGTVVASALGALKHIACHETQMMIEGPAVSVGAAQALPLTMILVEWFTNSCKYGAHSLTGGKLTVRWELVPNSGFVRLHWRERGGPRIGAAITPSLGSELVQGFATRELQGTCSLTYPPDGADHVLEFIPRT